ncbi:Iwr1p [Rhodotorula paludigena]|uniref:Iwr1p n=1 Tax=Rhodotorula paludigena TaxID=86838 RepID=UPI0031743EAF
MAGKAAGEGAHPPHLSILRIKRKRTDQPTPLDALVIEHAEPSHKRRKNSQQHPPDPQPVPGRGIFRFAETVPLDSFSTPSKTRSLRDRINAFLAHPPRSLSRAASSSSLRTSAFSPSTASAPHSPSTSLANSPVLPPGSPAGSARRKLPSSLRAARAAASAGSSDSHPPSPASRENTRDRDRASDLHADRSRLRYRIVEERRTATAAARVEAAERAREDDEIRRGLRPPRVVDSRAVAREREEREREKREREEEGIRIYEAVAEEGGEKGAEKGRRRRAPPAGWKKSEEQVREESAAMDQFGDMLKEYLSLQESITPSTGAPHPSTFTSPLAAPAPAPDQDERDSSTDSDEDFVYDVYYREVRPAGPSAGTAAAAMNSEAVGKDAGGAGGWDVGGLDGLKRIGQLAGLVDDEDDPDQLLMHEQDVDPSSEEEDHADQDSNEENDYRNDYPDDDDPDSDNQTMGMGHMRGRRNEWSDEDESDSEDEGGMSDSDGGYSD